MLKNIQMVCVSVWANQEVGGPSTCCFYQKDKWSLFISLKVGCFILSKYHIVAPVTTARPPSPAMSVAVFRRLVSRQIR